MGTKNISMDVQNSKNEFVEPKPRLILTIKKFQNDSENRYHCLSFGKDYERNAATKPAEHQPL